MENKELERILKSFKRIKAPRELDEKLAPYLIKEEKKGKNPLLKLSIGIAILIIFFSLYLLMNKQSNANFFYEPLYAATLTYGYFSTEIKVENGDNLRVILDGEIIKDTNFIKGDTITLIVETTPGLHYIILDVENDYDNTRYSLVFDIYSL